MAAYTSGDSCEVHPLGSRWDKFWLLSVVYTFQAAHNAPGKNAAHTSPISVLVLALSSQCSGSVASFFG